MPLIKYHQAVHLTLALASCLTNNASSSFTSTTYPAHYCVSNRQAWTGLLATVYWDMISCESIFRSFASCILSGYIPCRSLSVYALTAAPSLFTLQIQMLCPACLFRWLSSSTCASFLCGGLVKSLCCTSK